MSELTTTKDLVLDILIEKPATRNSDDLLYLEYLEKRCKGLSSRPISEVFAKKKEYDIAPFETVSRCRRYWQEKNPNSFGANHLVKNKREERENDFHARFMKGY